MIPGRNPFVAAGMLAGFYGAAPSAASAVSPFADRIDAISIDARRLTPDLLGAPVEEYRLWSEGEGGWRPIPFQIDQREDDGSPIVSHETTAEGEPARLGAEDEVVFMSFDIGPAGASPDPPGCEALEPIRISDEISGASGRAVLGRCPGSPSADGARAIRWDPARRMTSTPVYAFGWEEAELFPYDHLSFAGGPDFLDRVKVRCKVGKWGVEVTFNEQELNYRYLGTAEGSVRVTWRSDSHWSLPIVRDVTIPQWYRFYRDYAVLTHDVDADRIPPLFGLDFHVEMSHDYAVDVARPHAFLADRLEAPFPVTADPSPELLEKLNQDEMTVGGLETPEGTLMVRLDIRPEMPTREMRVYRMTDEPEPPESIPGNGPLVGYDVVRWDDVKPDVFHFTYYLYFMKGSDPSEFERYDRVFSRPLRVRLGTEPATVPAER